MAIFEFELICVRDDNFNKNETGTRIRRRVPISVLSSNLILEPLFLCDPNPRDLVSSFTDALENSARQSKDQMRVNCRHTDTAMKSKVAVILETLNQRDSHCIAIELEDDNSEKKLNTVFTIAAKSTHWFAGTFWEMLQYVTNLWVQQCEVRYQLYQELLTTYSR